MPLCAGLALATSERRIKMIDKAIEELFEANISGKVSDERFVKMTGNYEKEQKELLELVADGNKKLQDAEQNKVDLDCSPRRRNRSCRWRWRRYAETRSSSEFLHKAEHGVALIFRATPYPT